MMVVPAGSEDGGIVEDSSWTYSRSSCASCWLRFAESRRNSSTYRTEKVAYEDEELSLLVWLIARQRRLLVRLKASFLSVT